MRAKLIWLSPVWLVDMLKELSEMHYRVVEGLPIDAEPRGGDCYGSGRHAIGIVVQSASFKDIPDGDLLPEIRPKLWKIDPPSTDVQELHAVIRRLRKALDYYSHPVEGWAECEHADAYEESRRLVPDDEEEIEERREREEHRP